MCDVTRPQQCEKDLPGGGSEMKQLTLRFRLTLCTRGTNTVLTPPIQAVFFAIVVIVCAASAQTRPNPGQTGAGAAGAASIPAAYGQTAALAASQTARILELDSTLQKLRELQAKRGANSPLTEEERSLRLQMLESIQIATLDIDGVLGEITNERSELGDIRTSLQSRRDKSVASFTTAALLTGSGLGIAVNATQYSSLGTRTNNAGDTVGIVSGAASTVFSIIAAQRQKGPNGSVGNLPNMLAPLLGGTSVLHTYYPPPVMQYLQSVPPGEDASRGTRLEQLKQSWIQAGRLDSKKLQQTTAAATSSQNPDVKVSIDDLTNRIAMLGDVMGRVSLMKRDLAVLMSSYARDGKE
jgi:hypothetical protein